MTTTTLDDTVVDHLCLAPDGTIILVTSRKSPRSPNHPDNGSVKVFMGTLETGLHRMTVRTSDVERFREDGPIMIRFRDPDGLRHEFSAPSLFDLGRPGLDEAQRLDYHDLVRLDPREYDIRPGSSKGIWFIASKQLAS